MLLKMSTSMDAQAAPSGALDQCRTVRAVTIGIGFWVV